MVYFRGMRNTETTEKLANFLSNVPEAAFTVKDNKVSKIAKGFLNTAHYKSDSMFNGYQVHIMLLVLSDPNMDI